MPKPGRNQPCLRLRPQDQTLLRTDPRPSDDQLARAHVAQLARQAIPELAGLSDHALDHLWEELMDLPSIDYSLLITLPKLIGPDLQRLREAIEHDDPDWGWDALTAVAKQIDTHNNERDSPTPSSDSATNTASTAARPPTRSSTSTAAPPASSPPASSKPSPSLSASAAPPAASTSPPNHDRLSGASS